MLNDNDVEKPVQSERQLLEEERRLDRFVSERQYIHEMIDRLDCELSEDFWHLYCLNDELLKKGCLTAQREHQKHNMQLRWLSQALETHVHKMAERTNDLVSGQARDKKEKDRRSWD